MADIQIKIESDVTRPITGRAVVLSGQNGKHRATILVMDGGGQLRAAPYIQVIVHNASNRAWKGMGNVFKTYGEAVAHYRTPQIQELIRAAVEEAELARLMASIA